MTYIGRGEGIGARTLKTFGWCLPLVAWFGWLRHKGSTTFAKWMNMHPLTSGCKEKGRRCQLSGRAKDNARKCQSNSRKGSHMEFLCELIALQSCISCQPWNLKVFHLSIDHELDDFGALLKLHAGKEMETNIYWIASFALHYVRCFHIYCLT